MKRIFLILFLVFIFSDHSRASAGEEINITALVPGCGDELISFGEDCDGANLNGASCESRGFVGGALFCSRSCIFNTSNCESKQGTSVIFNNPTSVISNNVIGGDLTNNTSFRAGVVARLSLIVDGVTNLVNNLAQINSNPSTLVRTSPSIITPNTSQITSPSVTREVVSSNPVYNDISNVRVRVIARLRIFLFELRQMFGWIFSAR